MNRNTTQKRITLYIPQCYSDRPIVSQLVSGYGLVVNILSAQLEVPVSQSIELGFPVSGRLDLELIGSIKQIQQSLNYLTSLNIKLVSQFQTAGDSWDY